MSDAQLNSLSISSSTFADVDALQYSTSTSKVHGVLPEAAVSEPEEGHCVRGPWRVLYVALASVFFVLGMIGVVLPGLPTTPFLLLTSYFLARSWPQVNRLLMANRLVGSILRQWQESRVINPRVKVQAVALVMVAMIWLACFSSMQFGLRASALTLSATGLLVVCCLPTSQRELT